MGTPTKEDVKGYLEGLALDEKVLAALLQQLEKGRNTMSTLESWKVLSELQWEKFAGFLQGPQIYNYLRSEGPIIERSNASGLATFQFFTWKAKNPFQTLKLELVDGRLYLRTLLQENGFAELYWIDSTGGNVLVQQHESGFSIHVWEVGKTYKLRVKTSVAVDIDIKFSEKDKDKLNIFNVQEDFKITFDKPAWNIGDLDEKLDCPSELVKAIELFAKFNTLRLETSRRTIVSLFIHFATAAIPEGPKMLCVDEGTPLTITQRVNRDGEYKNVRYHGPVDFVIGHSKTGDLMPKDAGLFVIETKTSETFSQSLAQVVAQAAALLLYRRSKIPARGLNGSGGPIHFVRTDGEHWIFSRMTCEDSKLKVRHSAEYKVNIKDNHVEIDKIQVIFDWLRFVIKNSRDSSPRSSVIHESNDDAFVDTVITAGFASLGLNEEE